MMAALEIVLIFATGAIALVSALHRAATDWPYRLRLMRVFEALEARECPWRPYDLLEVVLVDPSPAHGARSIAFARTDRRDDVNKLILDRPLGDRADLCSAWSAAATPLLYAGDWNGGAVLQGPVDCFVGFVEHWSVSLPTTTRDAAHGELTPQMGPPAIANTMRGFSHWPLALMRPGRFHPFIRRSNDEHRRASSHE